MRIKAAQAGIFFIVLMISGLLLSMFTGYWKTENSKIPAKFSEGELAGISDPGDIRGSYSLGDIESAFDIPVETLAAAFGLTDNSDSASFQVKVFEEEFGVIDGKEVGTDSMRLFVALYLNLPYETEHDTGLPNPAVTILRKQGTLSEEQLAMLDTVSVSIESIQLVVSYTDQAVSEDHEESEIVEIKGSTSFSDIYDRGISTEQLEEFLGVSAGSPDESLRDFCKANDIEFSTVKMQLQDLLDLQ